MNFEQDLDEVLKKIKDTLMEKNKKYGDAALNPKKIFSKLTPLQSILARVDEKLSRAMEDNENEDEDIKKDLMGWLILAEIAEKRELNHNKTTCSARLSINELMQQREVQNSKHK